MDCYVRRHRQGDHHGWPAAGGLPEEKRPGLVVCVISTDGEENASKEYTGKQIAAMIKEQTESIRGSSSFSVPILMRLVLRVIWRSRHRAL